MFIKGFVSSKEGTLGNDAELRSIIQREKKEIGCAPEILLTDFLRCQQKQP